MLVLTRRPGESIKIGDDITIQVRHAKHNRISVAIEAPRDVRILRSELAKFTEPLCSTTTNENSGTEASTTKHTTTSSTPAGTAD